MIILTVALILGILFILDRSDKNWMGRKVLQVLLFGVLFFAFMQAMLLIVRISYGV